MQLADKRVTAIRQEAPIAEGDHGFFLYSASP